MGKSILDGCGRYSEKLIEISKAIVGQKIKNGERPLENDIWTIDSQIFEAYQTILASAKDSNVISKSIEYLKESVERSGSISEINNLAISAVQKSIEEGQRYEVIKEETSKVIQTVATSVIITDIMQDGSLNNLDNFLNVEVVNDLDNEIQKLKNGDKGALREIVAFKGAAETFGKYEKLDEKQTREVLARMMSLAASDSPVNKKLLKEIAKKHKFDIFDKEDGKTVINEEKLTDLYQSKLPENSKTTKRTIEDFKRVNEEKTQREKVNHENATQLTNKIKNTTKEKKVRNALNLALEQENEEALVQLCEKYPEEIKGILNEKIDAINKSQELGKKITTKRHQDILKISNGIKIAKEQEKMNPVIEENKDAR